MNSSKSHTAGKFSLGGKLYSLLAMAAFGMGLMVYLHLNAHYGMTGSLNKIGNISLPVSRCIAYISGVDNELKSIVYQAIYAKESGDVALQSATVQAIKQTEKNYTAEMEKLEKLPLYENTRTTIGALRPKLESFIQVSKDILKMAANGDTKGYKSALPAYQEQFVFLGEELDKLTETTTKNAVMNVDAGEAKGTSMLRIFWITFAVLITAFLSTGFLITRNVVKEEKQGKAKEIEVRRLTSLIEGSITNFMTCDLDLKITSANPSVVKLISRYQADLRKVFPSLDANNLIGTCIDSFHKSPEHQRRLLKDVRNLPFLAEIKVGDLSFGLNLSALYDAEGNHIGNGVEWIDNNARTSYRNEVDKLLTAMQEGELSVRGNEKAMDKVYGPMLAGINHIIEAVVEPLKEVKEKLAMVAAGDLAAYVTGEYKGDHQMLKNGLNDSLDSLNDILGQVAVAAEQVATGSRQVSDSSQALSQGATEQASSLEQITASMTEMAGQTKQNAENATQANQLASAARGSAEKGNLLMQDMVKAMTDIDESSQNISKIIKAIDEIAFQTNLLALNAAVEAARAGVHGKGFAVVAEEVRNLAARSAKAAKETTEMIEGSIKKVNMGSNIAKKTAESLVEMVSGVGKVTDLVGEIAAASNEQAQGIGQVNQGLTQLDQVTQQNTSSAEQSAAASQELSSQSAQLKQTLTKFRLKDGSMGTQGSFSGDRHERSGSSAGRASRPGPTAPRNGRNGDWQAVKPSGLGGTIHSNGTKPVISLDDKEFGRF